MARFVFLWLSEGYFLKAMLGNIAFKKAHNPSFLFFRNRL